MTSPRPAPSPEPRPHVAIGALPNTAPSSGTPMIRFFLVAFVCLSLVACTSTGGGGGADRTKAARLSLRDYRTGTTLSIVNDGYIARLGVEGDTSAMRRVAFYSEKHADPNTKVTEDAVLVATIRQLEKEGFGRWASPGDSDHGGTVMYGRPR